MPIHGSIRARTEAARPPARRAGASPLAFPFRICILLATAVPVLAGPVHAQGMLRGEEYLRRCASLGAVAADSGHSAAGDGAALDIAGRLSGTMGTGQNLALLIVSGESAWAVHCGDVALPPLGAEIRALAHVQREPGGSTKLTLEAWAFAPDVEKARRAPRPSRPSPLDARRRGPSASRGGLTDHTAYFRQYAEAISRINPRLTRQQVEQITRVLLDTSRECDVDPRLVMAVILAESGFNPNATSPKGAMGLGQLMPATARGMGLRDPYEPAQNLEASIRIIRSALNRYSGNASWNELNWEHLKLALAAYNAGSGAVRRYGGVPPYRETRNYIARVAAYYRQLCGEDARASR